MESFQETGRARGKGTSGVFSININMEWILFLLVMLPPLGNHSDNQRTFTSQQYEFRLSYPDSFTVLHPKYPPLTYIPICDDISIACVVYPADKYSGTNFEGAAVEVSIVPRATTQAECSTFASVQTVVGPTGVPSKDVVVSKEHEHEAINGTVFEKGVSGSAGLGHWMSIYLYRTFHNGRCYQLQINIAETSFQNYPAGAIREFTRDAEKKVLSELEGIVHSFEFLK